MSEYTNVGDAIAAELGPDWWGSMRGCTEAEQVIRRCRTYWSQARQRRGTREEVRKRFNDLMVQSDSALAEIRERKRILGESDDAGKAWKHVMIREIRARLGDAVFDEINAIANAEVERRTALRSTPMAAGSVLAPRGSSGGMKQRSS